VTSSLCTLLVVALGGLLWWRLFYKSSAAYARVELQSQHGAVGGKPQQGNGRSSSPQGGNADADADADVEMVGQISFSRPAHSPMHQPQSTEDGSGSGLRLSPSSPSQ